MNEKPTHLTIYTLSLSVRCVVERMYITIEGFRKRIQIGYIIIERDIMCLTFLQKNSFQSSKIL